MEQLAWKIGSAAVDTIAGNGVTDVPEMNPDLVGSSGFRTTLQQAETAGGFEDLPCCFGVARSVPGGDGHFPALHRMATDRAGDNARIGTRPAAHDGEIGLLRGALGELPGEGSLGGIRFGDENAAAGVLVQPVDDARPQGM